MAMVEIDWFWSGNGVLFETLFRQGRAPFSDVKIPKVPAYDSAGSELGSA
jgi:hypothetical protein